MKLLNFFIVKPLSKSDVLKSNLLLPSFRLRFEQRNKFRWQGVEDSMEP
jgi:hypothetical protein